MSTIIVWIEPVARLKLATANVRKVTAGHVEVEYAPSSVKTVARHARFGVALGQGPQHLHPGRAAASQRTRLGAAGELGLIGTPAEQSKAMPSEVRS